MSADKPKPCKVETVHREIIENVVMDALSTGQKVALLVERDDLQVLIDSLAANPSARAREFEADLRQLMEAAFE